MTNADKIRSMTDEELADFLHELQEGHNLGSEFCEYHCPYQLECDENYPSCYADKVAGNNHSEIDWWLKQPIID